MAISSKIKRFLNPGKRTSLYEAVELLESGNQNPNPHNALVHKDESRHINVSAEQALDLMRNEEPESVIVEPKMLGGYRITFEYEDGEETIETGKSYLSSEEISSRRDKAEEEYAFSNYSSWLPNPF